MTNINWIFKINVAYSNGKNLVSKPGIIIFPYY